MAALIAPRAWSLYDYAARKKVTGIAHNFKPEYPAMECGIP
jgi:hypothetical protein